MGEMSKNSSLEIANKNLGEWTQTRANTAANDNGIETLKPCVPTSASPKCTIYQGDCLEVMKSMPSGSIGLVVTSPPFNMGFKNRPGKGNSKKSSSWHKAELLNGYC